MATAPQIELRDGSGTTTALTFTTNESAIIITGTVTPDTAAIQISINGGTFVSDPTLILFNLQNFTVPNPASYPDGLGLIVGLNTIQLRTVDIIGAVSAASTVTVTRVLSSNAVITQIPTGVRVNRNRNTVDILALAPILIVGQQPVAVPGQVVQNSNAISVPATTSFLGFNIYASTASGGSTGYYKVNASPVLTPTTYEKDIITSANDTAIWDNTILQNVRIRVTEENDFGQILAVRYDNSYQVANLAEKLSFTDTFQSYHMNEFIVFTHNRAGGTGIINSEQFVSVAATDPLYYVVTAVFYDSALHQEIETPYSQEVLGTPLTIDTAITDLPGRVAADITTSYITQVQTVNANVAMIPGSTTRDVSIDPFASEGERLWFVLDFVHRSQSFLTLIQIDDANNTGTSDPVSSSPYKTALMAALGFQSTAAVQSLIDTQFDKLAGNEDKTRLPGNAATGQVVIYTLTAPIQDIDIPANSYVTAPANSSTNTTAVRFLIAGAYTLPAANAQAYYNFDEKRYQITVDIVCEQTGSIGNLPAGSITQISGVSGVLVTNDAATVFGTDVETNSQLAARAILGFVSVDTGTEGGYERTASSQVGIVKALVVKSGDPLMMRDYDPVRMKHIGGKVDIWVQGTLERTISETFAFTYTIASGIDASIINLATLTLRALDSRVTPSTPIIQVLSVFNVTQGLSYDLTGLTLVDYETFTLNPALPDQPTTHIDDVIEASYRFQVANVFTFSFQPVIRVVSVVGEVSGPLSPTNNIVFDKSADPLLVGESTISTDNISIIQYQGIPSGATITVNNEVHVLIGFFNEPLESIGINTDTIAVYSADRTTEYNGPGSSAPDYDIVQGTATTPAKLVRTATSNIVSGQTVSVDYVHDENFVVTYVINDLLQQLQAVVNTQRHVTADVLVKQTIENDVNLETTVQLDSGAVQSTVDPLIRTNTSLILNQKLIGQGVAQSNIDAAINDTTGVDFNVLPFALMGYADGSIKLRETVNSAYQAVPSLNIGGNNAYILTGALEYPTTDGGGLATETHGVFQDDVQMTPATSLATVASGPSQGWIIGAEGASITGYSDSATLIAQGYTTPAQIAAQQLVLTANHVVISLSSAGTPPDIPTNHAYTCTYIIRGDTGSHDITAAAVEYITQGDFTITYRTATS
jgi:hypothetical protein